MVDISKKENVYREAIAEGFIRLRKETVELIRRGAIEKGDVITVSKIAGILAAKKVSELLPLCHTIPLTHVDIDLKLLDDGIKVTTVVRTNAQTGVEMEALTATSIALLNIWDMVKKYEKDEMGQYPETVITNIRVVRKYKSST
ncbi:MAG: cyclic pyranopterin monophosphate synthase MoaC [Desulfurococcaceae archaeon]|nr:cyclic pyranopterin monophosphate synthase MoaC [Desulfurococcaceae archaeon]